MSPHFDHLISHHFDHGGCTLCCRQYSLIGKYVSMQSQVGPYFLQLGHTHFQDDWFSTSSAGWATALEPVISVLLVAFLPFFLFWAQVSGNAVWPRTYYVAKNILELPASTSQGKYWRYKHAPPTPSLCNDPTPGCQASTLPTKPHSQCCSLYSHLWARSHLMLQSQISMSLR